MAQAGLHGLAGMAVRKWTPGKTWLTLGIVLGNLFPDLDNFAVAFATVAGLPTEGLHRTFTHSLFTILLVVVVFQVVGRVTKKKKWGNLGWGLGIGMVMHILFDLLIWFNGVFVLWPIPYWLNFWENVTPPKWWMQLMLSAEFLAFAGFFLFLNRLSHRQDTDQGYHSRLRFWTWVQGGLFILFTALVYVMKTGFLTIYGALYLISLVLAINVILRMRETIETLATPRFS